MLERYGHGGDLLTATETFGKPQHEWIDFSSNMNPFGPPVSVRDILLHNWQGIANYPDPAVRKLRRKLADNFHIPVESILVGNGAAELIDLTIRYLTPMNAGVASPSFTEYQDSVAKSEGRIHNIPLQAERDFMMEQQVLEHAAESCDLLLLGHPNNPTGRLLPRKAVQAILQSNTQLVLDEAFIDFLPDEQQSSFITEAAERENVFVIRSMTKFFAIPGVRLGFMVAHPNHIQQLTRMQPPWSVNYFAQLIGEAVLDEQPYIKKTKEWLPEERNWLAQSLKLLGLQVYPSDANYLLAAVPAQFGFSVQQLQQLMARQGILIRNAGLFNGLDDFYFRIAVRLREDNQRLIAAVGQILRGRHV